jgi:peptidyl-prolyl cis-trans isomerase A (cyclophilin A)
MRSHLVALVTSALVAACGSQPQTPAADPSSQSPSQAQAPAQSNDPIPALATSPGLLDPTQAIEQSPEVWKARFWTSKGEVTIEVHRAWAPLGADRFYNLVKVGFFDGAKFFRVIDGFMAQFGISGDFGVSAKWHDASIKDDPVTQSNKRGYITFATSGTDSRTTQVFINFGDNSALDEKGFAPFGMVTAGMDAVDALYNGYGDGPPDGQGPHQDMIESQGNDYLTSSFPKLDSIKAARVVQ